MTVSPELLDILRCSQCKGELLFFEDGDSAAKKQDSFLFCGSCMLCYPVDEGIPVMIIEDATKVDEAEAKRLLTKHR